MKHVNQPMLESGIKFLVILALMMSALSCTDKSQKIVDDVIETHGGRGYHAFKLAFDFRNRHYTASRDGGLFEYTREFTDSTGRIRDVLNNDGFTRYRNDVAIDIPEERKQAFARSVNSVIYFALLPFGLNDDAVNKEWLGERIIRNDRYDLIRVTFDQEGGGEDHSDVFLYWFHAENKTMDFFAYTYETDGGGLRFREAVNRRRTGPFLLQDYINYKPADERVPLDSLMPMYLSGELQQLSVIDLVNPSVSPPSAH